MVGSGGGKDKAEEGRQRAPWPGARGRGGDRAENEDGARERRWMGGSIQLMKMQFISLPMRLQNRLEKPKRFVISKEESSIIS